MPMLSIVTPCFNEVDNLELLCRRIREVAEKLPGYSYEHIIVNNASTDGSQALLRRLAAEDPRIKVIFNVRNFGAMRSGYYSLLQATGDAVIGMSADLQDPPELIRNSSRSGRPATRSPSASRARARSRPCSLPSAASITSSSAGFPTSPW